MARPGATMRETEVFIGGASGEFFLGMVNGEAPPIASGYAYLHGVYTFAAATDNNLITFPTDVLIHAIMVQNESDNETTSIVKLTDTQIARFVLPAKLSGSFTPPFAPMRVPSGTVLRVNLSAAKAHNLTLLYRLA